MRIDDYAKWLRTLVSEAVVQNYIKRCQRVEKNLDVSLDLEFRKDRGASLLDQLTYTTEDWQKHRPLRCSINFRAGSDWYKGYRRSTDQQLCSQLWSERKHCS